ncbi:hypothetical protein FJ987_14395 [Mesorhizobium sp. CU2]|uniref:hypothetical protein n=1 Tax=unclassified Mesorhizobium TaxID=325217 RepID=UPI00112CF9CB|nr:MULTISPECIES: hypothetical protein [unclassified Mesorhizobium]TPN79505.1 hypothetical protein FJ988_22545 [Mesorhizobium sp. CU3]TPO14341.1 hypothetical protein FJ987_14395 [Mesorhizobium sp. CU2]
MAFKPIADAISKNRFAIQAKTLRNHVFYKIFESRGRASGRLLAKQLRDAKASRVCITIAFNTPWVIDALTKAWEMRPPGMTLVVVDNSDRIDARKTIARICETRGVPYLALPMRVEKHLSRSHGTAITWAFHNIVRHLKPELFGFIDHDCFPVEPFDIPSRLEGKAVYGRRAYGTENHVYKAQPGDRHWNLWAGYCFYRFAAVADRKLNFDPRLNLGLDTGGANWAILYSKLDEADVCVATLEQRPMAIAGAIGHHEVIDGAFFHLAGVSYPDRPGYHHRTAEHREMLRDYVWNTYLGGPAGQTVSDF